VRKKERKEEHTRRSVGESGVEPELSLKRFLIRLSSDEIEETRRRELVGVVNHGGATAGFFRRHRHFDFRLLLGFLFPLGKIEE